MKSAKNWVQNEAPFTIPNDKEWAEAMEIYTKRVQADAIRHANKIAYNPQGGLELLDLAFGLEKVVKRMEKARRTRKQ